MGLKAWGQDLLAMVYPRLCEVCDRPLVRGEDVICLHCRMSMPAVYLTDFDFNELHRRMASPGVPIHRAAACFEYHKEGDYAKLIHAAKYHGRPNVGRMLALEFAQQLESKGFFDGNEVIVPVPLHPLKRLRRGYNQTEYIAHGISDATGLPVDVHVLKTTRTHSSQTRKGVFDRWINTVGGYDADARQLAGVVSVLLVDDVITSGSTLLSCAKALLKASPGLRISVLTLGMTCD